MKKMWRVGFYTEVEVEAVDSIDAKNVAAAAAHMPTYSSEVRNVSGELNNRLVQGKVVHADILCAYPIEFNVNNSVPVTEPDETSSEFPDFKTIVGGVGEHLRKLFNGEHGNSATQVVDTVADVINLMERKHRNGR